VTDKDDNNLVEKAVKKALSLGGSAAEAYLTRNKELTIEVRDRQVETMKMADQQGLGIRIFQNQRLGFAYTSDLSDSALDQVVAQAAANSASTAPDDFLNLPAPSSYPDLSLSDPVIGCVSLEEKIELAKQIEFMARGYDPRIKITERCGYTESLYQVTISNSLGLAGSYQGAYCGAYSFLVAEEKGKSETGFGFQYRLNYQDIDPQFVALEGAKKAVRLLGAKSMDTQETTAVFDPYVAAGFLGLIFPSLSAESVQKGKSSLAGRRGEKISSPLISITDDGTRTGGIMSAPFDGEGVPCRKTKLVEKGILQGFLYNSYTAAKDGTVSTGNGTRSYQGIPEVGITNFFIENGTLDKDKMIEEITQGIYITEVMGMHTANPISGDFSLGAAGLLIENGKLSSPIRGIAIAGNVFDLLSHIDGVASDLTFFVGRGSPTLRVSRLAVSGS